MESFIERFKAQATKARQAQSRMKALERMVRIAPAHVDSPFEFSFAEPEKLPRPLLAIEKQSVGYDGRAVLESVTLTLAPGDRIALLGRNGAGKSTCMKMLAGELPALAGTRTEARDLKVGYFAQHQLEQVSPKDSPLTNLKRFGAQRAARATEQELRDYLASFGFRGDRVFEPIGPFSGGEKARLVLALVAYLRPNLMLLDEPTNHLDLEMRQALTVALQDYTGAVVLVSHDRHLLRTVADQFYIVHAGKAVPFDGDLEDYAKWLNETDSESPAARAASNPAATPSAASTSTPVAVSDAAKREPESAESRKQRKREEAERRNRLSPLRATIEKCERDLERLTKERNELQSALEAPDLYTDTAKDRLRKLMERQTQIAREIEQTETSWLEHTERLEAEMAKL
jgi:ATP-binding cassette subfamily F protein 3